MRTSLSVALVAPLVAPLTDAHPYGNQHFVRDLACGLCARGHEVVVYAAAGSAIQGVPVVTVDVDARAQRRFLLLRGNAEDEADAMQRAFDALFAKLRRAGHDVVSQHAFDREAIDACRGLHALHTLHLPPMRDDMIAAVRDCDDALASVSATCAAAWSDALARPVLPLVNGVPDFAPSRPARVDDVALIAGRISREKGIATALRAARPAGLRPRVVGEIYDRDYFERDVAPQLGDVAPEAPISRAALAQAMARATVTLMPVAWDEPFGLVAAEAQLAGCPVVGYRRGALPEIVEEGVGGYLVDADDEIGLVDAIRRSRGLDRCAMRVRARGRFGMSACIDRYEAALRRVAQ